MTVIAIVGAVVLALRLLLLRFAVIVTVGLRVACAAAVVRR